MDRFQILEQKYWLQSLAAQPIKDVEASILNQIDMLWKLPNQLFNILRACADSGASAPKNPNEELAVEGYVFCRDLLHLIDFLKSKKEKISLKDVKTILNSILNLIKINMKKSDPQFPQVSAIIYEIMPHGKKHDRKIRDQEYAKARKGLSRITDVALTMLNEINKLEDPINPEEREDRFTPQGAKLSNSEIMSFIRQHGDTYGIPDLETWSLVVDTDPALELPLTKLVHALSRGRVPNEADKIKPIIQNIINRHQELTQTNAPTFEEGEAWDHKMAYKYNDLTLNNMFKKGIL